MVEPSLGNTPGAQESERVTTKQRRIAALAQQHPEFCLSGASYLAEVAQTPQWPATADLGPIQRHAATPAFAGATHRSHLRLATLSEPAK